MASTHETGIGESGGLLRRSVSQNLRAGCSTVHRDAALIRSSRAFRAAQILMASVRSDRASVLSPEESAERFPSPDHAMCGVVKRESIRKVAHSPAG